ncbi:MAG: SDR family NAD(P)-dependent oxidoreductase [bacterium]
MSTDVLVTGGAGFIGSFIVDKLIEKGYKVRIFDNLDSQVHPGSRLPKYLNREAEFIQGDIRDYEKLATAVKGVEIIFHYAASVGVAQSQYEIKKYIDVNIGGTANLLDILVNQKYNIKKLIVAASMSSYGEGNYRCNKCGIVRSPLRSEEQMEKKDWELYCPNCQRKVEPVPTDERARRISNSIYAITKMGQEEMVMNIGKTYSIPAVALRLFNVYGPHQSLSNPYTGVVAIFMSRIKNGHPPVIYEDGKQTRDFVSVHDVVQANMLALEKDEANYEVFNVGSGVARSIKNIAETLAGLCQVDIVPEITEKFRKGDVRHCFSDISKIKDKLGFKPAISFEVGMKELIEWSDKEPSTDKFEQASQELKEKGLI